MRKVVLGVVIVSIVLWVIWPKTRVELPRHFELCDEQGAQFTDSVLNCAGSTIEVRMFEGTFSNPDDERFSVCHRTNSETGDQIGAIVSADCINVRIHAHPAIQDLLLSAMVHITLSCPTPDGEMRLYLTSIVPDVKLKLDGCKLVKRIDPIEGCPVPEFELPNA